MKYEAILVHSPRFSVRKMCGVLGLKESSYYQWRSRRRVAEERTRRDKALADEIRATFEENRCVYGYRMMVRALAAKGVGVSVYRVRKIMRQTGLYPVSTKKFRPGGSGKASGRYLANVLARVRGRGAERAMGRRHHLHQDQGGVGVSDHRGRPVQPGDRRLCGVQAHRLRAREEGNVGGTWQDRREREGHGLSLRSRQYASKSFQTMLRAHGMVGSMSRPGCPYDNAVAESFFSTAKRECIYRKEYKDLDEVRADLFSYIELFYNRKRMHSSLGYRSPAEFKRLYLQGNAA